MQFLYIQDDNTSFIPTTNTNRKKYKKKIKKKTNLNPKQLVLERQKERMTEKKSEVFVKNGSVPTNVPVIHASVPACIMP